MSKLEHIKEIIRSTDGADLSNADVARRVGCDEGMVRRARQQAQVEMLEARLAACNCEKNRKAAEARAARKAERSVAIRPLWERPTPDGPAPTVPMIGE